MVCLPLEGFWLAADPVNRRLISVPGLLKAAPEPCEATNGARRSGPSNAPESRSSAAPSHQHRCMPVDGQARAASSVAAITQTLANTVAIIVVLRR